MAMTEAARHEFIDFGSGLLGEQSGAGVVLLVLGILALASIDPALLNAIAVIVAGVSLMLEGASLSARYARTMRTSAGDTVKAWELSGGMSAGLLAGTGGVVLGILAILGIAIETLIPIALILFGAAVLFDFGAKAHLKAMAMVTGGSPADLARTAGASSSMASVLVGVALITLGILGLAHLQPAILAAAAFLSLGAYLLLDSAASLGWFTDIIGM
jgi:hypothetical protein